MIEKTEIASESHHWYWPDGRTCYEVEKKTGPGMRPTTLADARKLGLYPSVTSIIGLMAAPGLEAWKQRQVLLASMTLPRSPDMTEDAWMKAVMADSQEQARKAADRGKSIHAAIESHYRNEPHDIAYSPHVLAVRDAISSYFPGQKWVPEKSFASTKYGYGCKIDLCSESRVVIDFKTKEFEEGTKLLAWDEHCMQLAANAVCAFGDTPPIVDYTRCVNIFVSTTVPGLARIIEWDNSELWRGWRMFKSLLDLFYYKTGLPCPY